MMPAPDHGFNGDPPPIKSAEGVQELLRVADALHDKCAELRDTLWNRTFVLLLLVPAMMVLTAFACRLLREQGADLRNYYWGASTIGFCTFSISFWLPARTRLNRELATNLRTLHSLVDLLRAIEPHLTQESTLSFVEQASFRIRLGRFDIGPESEVRYKLAGPPPASPLEPRTVPPRDARQLEQPTHS